MRAKRILAWICALCVCMGLTGCATGINMEGMSDEELKALEAAAREKLEKRREANLDAMSDEELEALMAEAQERLKPSLGEMSFDELIALKDEVEKRLGPPPEVVPSEDVLVLQGGMSGGMVPEYAGNVDIPLGIWYAKPLPKSYSFFGMYEMVDAKKSKRKNILLDDCTGKGMSNEIKLTITPNTVVYVRFEPLVLRRTKSEARQCIFDDNDIITVEKLDAMDKVQIEALYYDINGMLYANALEFVDDKWSSEETIIMEDGFWHVGKDIPAGVWRIRPVSTAIAILLLKQRLDSIGNNKEDQFRNYIASYFEFASEESEKQGIEILFMPNTWMELGGTVSFSRK